MESERTAPNYSLKLSDKKTSNTESFEKKWENKSKPPYSSQSEQSPNSETVCVTKKKRRARTLAMKEKIYLASNPPAINHVKLMQEIFILQDEQRRMIKTINEIKRMLEEVLDFQADQKALYINQRASPIDEGYKLALPFDTYEKFDEFNKDIRENVELREYFIEILSNIVTKEFDNNENLVKKITAILKNFITKDVAAMYNAQDHVRGRYAFKETCFYHYLRAIICDRASNISPISEKILLTCLELTLCIIENGTTHKGS